jgi:hypothetical protein
MTEFMHTPWGGEHRVYRKTVTFAGREEDIDFCDTCGTEVYPAIVTFDPGVFIRLDGLD